MTASHRVLGIVLVHNEDRFVRRAVSNAMALCDEMLLVDHRSTDGTPAILRELAHAHPAGVSLRSIRHPRESHEMLKAYAGTNTWVFAVDGDEIYDPAGLARLRPRLVGGEFDAHWMVVGHTLHCDFVDERAGRVAGFPAPPSRSITKLFNFAAIDCWDGDTPERLHGGQPVFRPGHHAGAKHQLGGLSTWEDADFRCLHPCFVARSSLDRPGRSASRLNIMELRGARNLARRIARRFTGRAAGSDWKREHYRRGERLEVDARPFFPID